MIYTESDLKNERATEACKLFLYDRGVPYHILDQFHSGAFLDQFYHLVMNHRMQWRDAVNWINDHRNEILEHEKAFEKSNPIIY
jgi:hypothetical protein